MRISMKAAGALATAATWAAIALFSCGASAETVVPAERFRILFEAEAQSLPQSGPDAAANDAAITRIAYIDVKPACASANSCEAAALILPRMQAVWAAVHARTRKAGDAATGFVIATSNVRFLRGEPPPYAQRALFRIRPDSTCCSTKSVPGNTLFYRRGDRHSERRRDTPVSGRGRHCFPCRQTYTDQFPLLYN